MTLNLPEVLESALALSRAERAEVAHELIASLESTNERDEARYAELKVAVEVGIASLDAGEGLVLKAEEIDNHLRELGRLATERVVAKSA